ncbi:MAG: hypothetical protein KGS72_13700 [Cyanobacteria bacterium REEB67]|nr:hypothetical protein [Cyanobacteria bacterium REEB67]
METVLVLFLLLFLAISVGFWLGYSVRKILPKAFDLVIVIVAFFAIVRVDIVILQVFFEFVIAGSSPTFWGVFQSTEMLDPVQSIALTIGAGILLGSYWSGAKYYLGQGAVSGRCIWCERLCTFKGGK